MDSGHGKGRNEKKVILRKNEKSPGDKEIEIENESNS